MGAAVVGAGVAMTRGVGEKVGAVVSPSVVGALVIVGERVGCFVGFFVGALLGEDVGLQLVQGRPAHASASAS